MIYTVNGPLCINNRCNVLMHEHVGTISNDLMHIFGKKWLDKDELANFTIEIFKSLKNKYSVGLIVDGTPIDLGRDVLLLKKVSKGANIPIVASTGLYHYPSLYTSNRSITEIASWFIYEFEHGMENTDVKPGILKVATGIEGITEDNYKRLSAMSRAADATNLPLYVHSTHVGDIARKQLDILLQNIRNPAKIIIGHAAQNLNVEYLERMLDLGCYLCIDQCHCTKYSISDIGKNLVLLCQKGYTKKILLSNDLCVYMDFGVKGHTGLNLSVQQQVEKFGYIFEIVYKSFLENGGEIKDWDIMFKSNPIDVLNI